MDFIRFQDPHLQPRENPIMIENECPTSWAKGVFHANLIPFKTRSNGCPLVDRYYQLKPYLLLIEDKHFPVGPLQRN